MTSKLIVLAMVAIQATASLSDQTEVILGGCAKAGYENGLEAEALGCAAVKDKCRVKTAVRSAIFNTEEASEDVRGEEVLNRTCDILFESECQQAALKGVKEGSDATCRKILMDGPAPRPGCESIQEAMGIFYEELSECKNPCACSVDGFANGIPTKRGECKQHLLQFGDEDHFCYVVSSKHCSKDVITESEAFPGTYWKLCGPSAL